MNIYVTVLHFVPPESRARLHLHLMVLYISHNRPIIIRKSSVICTLVDDAVVVTFMIVDALRNHGTTSSPFSISNVTTSSWRPPFHPFSPLFLCLSFLMNLSASSLIPSQLNPVLETTSARQSADIASWIHFTQHKLCLVHWRRWCDECGLHVRSDGRVSKRRGSSQRRCKREDEIQERYWGYR